jgi:hypothetical protein
MPKAIGANGQPAPNGWPDFAAGAGYLMTGRLAAELYQAANRVGKPSKMEDIFVTAQCAQLVPGAHPPKHDPRFTCGGVVQDDCRLISL